MKRTPDSLAHPRLEQPGPRTQVKRLRRGEIWISTPEMTRNERIFWCTDSSAWQYDFQEKAIYHKKSESTTLCKRGSILGLGCKDSLHSGRVFEETPIHPQKLVVGFHAEYLIPQPTKNGK